MTIGSGNERVHINTLRPRQNGHHFTDDILKRILLNGNIWITIKNSLKFVPKGLINNIPALVQIMAWCHPGDKPLSEPMLISLPTHICVTRPQRVKCSGLYAHRACGSYQFTCSTKIFTCPANICKIPVKLKYNAQKIKCFWSDHWSLRARGQHLHAPSMHACLNVEPWVMAWHHTDNYTNPGYGLSLVDTLWNAGSYRQPLEQEGNPMTWIEKFWLQISWIVAKKS